MLHTQKKGTLVNAWYIVLFLLLFPHFLCAKLPFNMFNCTLSGYIKGETYTDSRQTVGDELVDISYFPKRPVEDPAGHDINGNPATFMDAFESRVCLTLDGLKMNQA